MNWNIWSPLNALFTFTMFVGALGVGFLIYRKVLHDALLAVHKDYETVIERHHHVDTVRMDRIKELEQQIDRLTEKVSHIQGRYSDMWERNQKLYDMCQDFRQRLQRFGETVPDPNGEG